MRVLLMIINLLIALLGIGAAGLAASLRIIKQYERGLIFRFGRVLDKTRGPGLAMIIPVADRLRTVIGKSELDDLLSNRERLNEGLEAMIDSPALSWGIHIDRVEIKDVALPDSMKRSMS